ncbi:D-alanine aminotransferase [hydrothermal vent metagenome]|uniref:D-alanine aminotransferase n=1 Tax=hydrothermal vent metagenome TaxID=652676 RepID=A0A3B0Z3A6_9ZZZZ
MANQSIVYLNGEFVSADEAKISIFDRGFVFGDGVYEVIPVYGTKLFRLKQHLERLDRSLTSIRITLPLSHEQWEKQLDTLIAKNPHNGLEERSIYIQITRGVAPRDHKFPEKTPPTIVAICNPLTAVDSDLLAQGAAVITMEDFRWQRCNIKAISLLPNVLARQQAMDNQAQEVLFFRDNRLTEGAASNVFIVENGRIITPPKSEDLLAGITRDLVLELALAHNIAHAEEEISLKRAQKADEIWLTSSTKEILPVTLLDGKPISSGQPGSLWVRMLALYQTFKNEQRV